MNINLILKNNNIHKIKYGTYQEISKLSKGILLKVLLINNSIIWMWKKY